MAKLWTVIEGLEGKDALEMIRFVSGVRKAHVKIMAKETQVVIRRIIKSRVQRAESTGNLAMWAGKYEILGNGSAGVGNIDDLNENVPYWRHVNFGSVAIGANWRHKVPVGGFMPGFDAPGNGDNQRWFVAQGGTSFVPTRPLPAMNYIEATVATMNTRAQSILSRVTVRSIGLFG